MSEEKQVNTMSKALILYSCLLTLKFDPNQNRETRKYFMFYISGIVFALSEMLNVSPSVSYYMQTKALTLGVPNHFPYANCDVVNFSENKAIEHIKYVGDGEWNDFEKSIALQGMDDIKEFILNENYDVTDNFYNRFVA